MKPGRIYHKYKDGIVEWANNTMLMEKFGWTLEYVRNIDYEDRCYLIAFLTGKAEGEKEAYNKDG